MQPNMTSVKSLGDLGGTKVAMSVDSNSIEHIMSVLTDLYSDPIKAVIREYSTNAADSHVAAGQTRPIEITLPTQFDSNFRVRDFGVGLSVDDIANVYSQYGASTKRGTNDQTGMLGLGCKSGLTYADQFVVNATKNGVLASAVISRTESGAGVIEIVDTRSTTDHDGVEIVIPTRIQDYNQFRESALSFFSYWPDGSVLVNGEPVARFDAGRTIALTNDLHLVYGMENHIVVMGNVAYSVEFDKIPITVATQRSYWGPKFGIVAFVKMGAVNFTPSREQLHMTRLTQNTLSTIAETFDRLVIDKVVSDIASAPTHIEAWRLYNQWSEVFKIDVSYRGDKLSKGVDVSVNIVEPGRRNGIHRHTNGLGYEWHKAFIVYGISSTNSTQRRAIQDYAEMNSISLNGGKFLISSSKITNPFMSEATQVSWDEVKVATRKTRSAEYRKSAGTYPIIMADSNWVTDSVIPDVDNIYYIEGNRHDDFEICHVRNLIPDATIVKLPANRVAKFRRDFPEIPSVKSALQDIVVDNVRIRDKYDVLVSQYSSVLLRELSLWDENVISDPAIVTAILDSRQALKSNWASEHRTYVNSCSKFGIDVIVDDGERCASPKEALANYPLLPVDYLHTWAGNVSRSHIYQYINNAYTGGN